MEEKQIQQVMKILTDWNPLCDEAFDIPDLDNYRTEACDILFHINFQKTNTEKEISSLIKTILNQAFDLILTNEDCMDAGKKIYKIVNV